MSTTESLRHPHTLHIDDHPTHRHRSPPSFSALPQVDTKPLVMSNGGSVPTTPKPLSSPTPTAVKSDPTERLPESRPYARTPPPTPPKDPEQTTLDKVDADTTDKEAPTTPADDKDAERNIINMDTFNQILELDDGDSEQEFSRGMVWAYFTQAEETFGNMTLTLQSKNLAKLSELGHFLKGSSAALGVSKVQSSCEKIQHYGQKRDEEAKRDLDDKEALAKIEKLLGQVQLEYAKAKNWLEQYYDNPEPAATS